MNDCQHQPVCTVQNRRRRAGNEGGVQVLDGEQNLQACPTCGQYFCFAHMNVHRVQAHGGS